MLIYVNQKCDVRGQCYRSTKKITAKAVMKKWCFGVGSRKILCYLLPINMLIMQKLLLKVQCVLQMFLYKW